MIWENNCQKYPNERAQGLQEWVTNLVQRAFWGCWPKPCSLWEKSIWCYSSAQGCEETLLPKPGDIPTQHRLFHTVCKVPGEHEWGGRSCSWLGTKSKDAPGTDHRMCHRAPVHSWPEATRLEVSGMGLTKQTESCSWRHIVSWKEQDTGTVWVTWLGLGHEAIVKMGRKCNCKSENRKNASRI